MTHHAMCMHVCVCVPLPGAFCIPVYIPYNLTGRWMLGKGLCKVWLVMDYLLCTASVFNIVLISYDRFLSVTRAVSTGCRGNHTHRHTTDILPPTILNCVNFLSSLLCSKGIDIHRAVGFEKSEHFRGCVWLIEHVTA